MHTKNEESLFMEHCGKIKGLMRKNRSTLSALHLEDEDVWQQLSIALLLAIRRFDPGGSASPDAHIWRFLRHEMLNIKRRSGPHGVTGVPRGFRPDFTRLDETAPGIRESYIAGI